MQIKLVSEPAEEPLSIEDIKAYLKLDLDDTSDDNLLASLVTAARMGAERYMQRALITQTWDAFWDRIPADQSGAPGQISEWWEGVRDGARPMLNAARFVELPWPPLQSVTYVQSYDDDDNVTAFPTTSYFVDNVGEPGRVVLRLGAVWPVFTRQGNGFQVRFVAGYGDTGDALPEGVKQGILRMVAYMYENRGDEAVSAAAIRGQLMRAAAGGALSMIITTSGAADLFDLYPKMIPV